jgi:hypothetical protein
MADAPSNAAILSSWEDIHAMPGPQTPFSRDELVAFLNRMLEAERAGANALLNILEQLPRRGEAWTALRRVHADEAHNCVLLGKQIQRLGADYSHTTGDFLGKLLAVEGRRARVEFLAQGLRWAVSRFDEASPRMADSEARDTISGMRESHLRSIETCESVARTLTD